MRFKKCFSSGDGIGKVIGNISDERRANRGVVESSKGVARTGGVGEWPRGVEECRKHLCVWEWRRGVEEWREQGRGGVAWGSGGVARKG